MALSVNKKYDYLGALLILFVFLVQVFLVFVVTGNEAEVLINPFLLFAAALIIPVWYLRLHLQAGNILQPRPEKNKFRTLLYFIAGMATILVSYEEVRKLFVHYPDPAKLSDVMPHMEVIYDRFMHHQYPYTPIHFPSYTLYPVYMPLHWLPLYIPRHLGIDDRWIGFIFLTIASGIFGIYILRNTRNWLGGFIAIVLPSIAFWAFITLGNIEMPASLEPLIAAYYLVLATGLAMRNLPLVVTGIVLCLLSRYTFIFWLPLFAVLLWKNLSVKKSVMVWGIVLVCFLLLYFIPFYLKDPKALADGLAYYNNCAIDAWSSANGQAFPNTFSGGLNFGPHMWLWFPGSVAHRVLLSRVVQTGSMLILLVWGLLWYNKHKSRINFYDFSLVMLYLFLTFFFMFTAQLFKYYLLTWLVLSAVICAKVILLKSAQYGKDSKQEDIPDLIL